MPPDETVNLPEHAALQRLGAQMRDVAPVVADSVLNATLQFEGGALRPTSDGDLQEAFGSLRHIGVETRVALSETEAYLATLLLPLPAVAGLLSLPLDDDATEESAAPVIERLRDAGGQFVDLLTLMLFTDSPIRGEIALSDVRLDGIDESAGMIADTAAGAPLWRLDADLVQGDLRAPITLILPESLLMGITAAAEAAPAPAEAASEGETSGDGLPPLSAMPGVTPDTGLLGDAMSGAFDDDLDDERIPVSPLRFPDLAEAPPGGAGSQPLDLILDVSMRVSVELGRSTLTVQEILAMGPGSVVELDKLAGEPVDILVNDRLIGRGEVVMVDENFGVRVTEILSPRTAQVAG